MAEDHEESPTDLLADLGDAFELERVVRISQRLPVVLDLDDLDFAGVEQPYRVRDIGSLLPVEDELEAERLGSIVEEPTRQIQVRIANINLEIGRLETEISEFERAEAPRLEGIKTRRLDAYQAYFSNLAKEQTVLQSLYDPIRGQLEERALLKGKDLEFSIRWTANVDSWLSRGEALFDQRKTIPYGSIDALGKAARKSLLPAWTSGDAQRIRESLDGFLQPFRDAQQLYLRTNVTMKDLMSWFFEVEHITLDYGLKFNNSELESRLRAPRVSCS